MKQQIESSTWGRGQAAGLAAGLALALAACGGSEAPAPPAQEPAVLQAPAPTAQQPAPHAPVPADEEPATFEQRAQALAAASPPAAGEPGAATADEARRRSLQWATEALAAQPSGSVVALPPLYFGLAFALDAAARGDTRAALREVLVPASPEVQAAMQRGLERNVSAGGASVFEPDFLDALTARGQGGTWNKLTLGPLTDKQLDAEPRLRMSVNDSLSARWPWPAARAYDGVIAASATGGLKVPMVEVQGPMLGHQGAGYEAGSMALPGGHWLVRLVPAVAPAQWGAAAAAAALAEVVPTLTPQAAATAPSGQWRLPLPGPVTAAGLDDRRGMAPAMDRVNADLRGLDGGGTYLETSAGSAQLSLTATEVGYSGSQLFRFIFAPENRWGPGYGYGSEYTWVQLGGSYPPCPTEPADVRPYLLAHIQPGGTVAMLARMNSYSSARCGEWLGFGFRIVPPPGP